VARVQHATATYYANRSEHMAAHRAGQDTVPALITESMAIASNPTATGQYQETLRAVDEAARTGRTSIYDRSTRTTTAPSGGPQGQPDARRLRLELTDDPAGDTPGAQDPVAPALRPISATQRRGALQLLRGI
jgi:hypothetical protein